MMRHKGTVIAFAMDDERTVCLIYLASDKNNFKDLFEKVVDPQWLAESNHPNAIAMRQAEEDKAKNPPCWRIMHRVTFVSRILPEFPDDTTPPIQKAMHVQGIESNWQLIKRIEPFVKNKTDNEVAFQDGIRSALKKYMPELASHETEIIQYMKDYYGMVE
jgi:hypothetical protein